MVDDRHIPRDPHLVAVRGGIGERNGRHAARLGGIGDIEDCGAESRTIGNMAHIGVTAMHGDLAGASQIEMTNSADIAGELACIYGCAVQCHVLSTSKPVSLMSRQFPSRRANSHDSRDQPITSLHSY